MTNRSSGEVFALLVPVNHLFIGGIDASDLENTETMLEVLNEA
jgi:hypothetical protein